MDFKIKIKYEFVNIIKIDKNLIAGKKMGYEIIKSIIN